MELEEPLRQSGAEVPGGTQTRKPREASTVTLFVQEGLGFRG